jgi:hypothetical protein
MEFIVREQCPAHSTDGAGTGSSKGGYDAHAHLPVFPAHGKR